ncbi:hypothetical protein K8B33_05185 [Alcanivorax sp. JB21]|uniref:hypothetical protein n=1 Tax=Alcanivorax limicola TaxID=2874102 RepID=UPI001CBF0478|nr:hypothetical protein [Alcanivorax limicola]MBZ2188478.1 hypothetical protein [Alcanivorax limicola]
MKRHLATAVLTSACLAACGGGGGGSSAAPAPQWSPTTPASVSGLAQTNSRIVMDDNDIATVAFSQRNASNDRDILARRVGPVTDNTTVLFNDADAFLNEVQHDTHGNVSVSFSTSGTHINYLRRFNTGTGTWGPRITIANNASCEMALNSAGDAGFLCADASSGDLSLYVYTLAGNSGTDVDREDISNPAGQPQGTRIVAEEDDNWLLVWTSIANEGGTDITRLYSTTLHDIQGSTSPVELDTPLAAGDTLRLQGLAHRAGQGSVLNYLRLADTLFEQPQFLYGQQRNATGAWQAPVPMSTVDGDPLPYYGALVQSELVMSADGSALLVWDHSLSNEAPRYLVSRRLPPGSSNWRPMVSIPGANNPGNIGFRLTAVGARSALALWGDAPEDGGVGSTTLRASRFTPSSGWSQRGTVSDDPAQVLQVNGLAGNANGRAIVSLRDVTTTLNSISLAELCPAAIIAGCAP